MTTTPIRRLAIVNRGEAARRCLRAVRERDAELGRSTEVVALVTDPDRRSLIAREADRVIELGPALRPGPDGRPRSAYLDHDLVIDALVAAGVDAVWPGWGFVAEDPAFADRCADAGIVFVGPPGDVMRTLGDKIAAKRLAEKAGVPVAAWSNGAVDVDDAPAHAARIGFPLVVKATAGGGGRGIRFVRAETELADAIERARTEAAAAFGDPSVFLEAAVVGARHVEVQLIADAAGTAWALGVRDCSVQRRNQKVIEESASTELTADENAALRAAAVRLAHEAGYVGAGTVEFLFQTETRTAAFMEVNTRLQVEHPVTELVTGVDLVKLQLDIAEGGLLPGAEPPPETGHAVEARLCAEDPAAGFAPAPGRLAICRFGGGPGVRIDAGVVGGDRIPAEFDSMIAKVCAVGATRTEAFARLRRALTETTVVVEGGTTNKGFLLELCHDAELAAGAVDIGWLDRRGVAADGPDPLGLRLALVAAACEIGADDAAVAQARFFATAARGRPEVPAVGPTAVELRVGATTWRGDVAATGGQRWRVHLDSDDVDVAVERLGPYERRLTAFGRTARAVVVEAGADLLVEIDGVPYRIGRDDGATVRSPGPGVVVRVLVHVGDEIVAGDRLAILESMKMETAVVAPFGGTVKAVAVDNNQQVDVGAPLVVLAADTDAVVLAAPTVDVDFRGGAAEVDTATAALGAMRDAVLGWDADANRIRRWIRTYTAVVPTTDAVALGAAEDAFLDAFADVAAIGRRRPDADDLADGGEVRSARTAFDAWLAGREPSGAGLPATQVAQLERVLARHGVHGLEPSAERDAALFRTAVALQSIDTVIPGVLAVLDRRLATAGAAPAGAGVARLLDRLLLASQRRHPAVADLTRELRYRSFDEPLYRAVRERVDAEMDVRIRRLLADPDSPGRDADWAALVDCPQPMIGLLGDFLCADGDAARLALELLSRRHARAHGVARVDTVGLAGTTAAIDVALDDGGRVVAASCTADQLAPALAAVAGHRADAAVDLYVACDADADRDVDARSAAVCAALDTAGSGPTRVTVSYIGAGAGANASSTLTFRPDPTTQQWSEDQFHRGIHPMLGERLDLWRLQNFALRRLASADDVYLFRGVATDDSADERLFALAEVRDLTPVLDARGKVVALPHLERMLLECLAGIRREQASRPPRDRLHWNRVLLTITPPYNLGVDSVFRLARRLAPVTEGLGLEKVVLHGRFPRPDGGFDQRVLEVSNPAGAGLVLDWSGPKTEPLRPLSPYRRTVVRLRARGLSYPYEIVEMLAPREGAHADLPPGTFCEYDLESTLDAAGGDEAATPRLVPVTRPPGQNTAGVVVGTMTNVTDKHPEGMTRVIILGDPSRSLGALAGPECDRIIAALDLAAQRRIPVEWFAISSGARIAMDSGTENMDAISRALRRIVTFTQDGGEINVIVAGITVGAQPYFNAEATMLMHTRGILVMTPDGAMVLTGKQSLDYSGGVSAEDNFGIGGFDRIMGPNGQAQYFAADLIDAARILFRHYDHTYVAPGEATPRRAVSVDATDRDVRLSPHPAVAGGDFTTVGDVFSHERNPDRKKPFDIRAVMRAVADADREPLERWAGMRHADTAVVWDAHLGGMPVCLLGIESRPIGRSGFIPADGPETWTAGTLFPQSSKKVARAICAASGNRPLVVLANLSGFDGSPESMRNLQLEYGAEIGRAVVNFRGPIVFCLVSRYHGGAFVVFSKALNDEMVVLAVEGSKASVIGGAPAAAVVFAQEVRARVDADARVQAASAAFDAASGSERADRRTALDRTRALVRAEKLGEVADEFDHVHTVERARDVGSVDRIISAAALRPELIAALEAGLAR